MGKLCRVLSSSRWNIPAQESILGGLAQKKMTMSPSSSCADLGLTNLSPSKGLSQNLTSLASPPAHLSSPGLLPEALEPPAAQLSLPSKVRKREPAL